MHLDSSSSLKRKKSTTKISDSEESDSFVNSDEESDDGLDDLDHVAKSRKVADDDDEDYSEVKSSKKKTPKPDSRSIRKSTLSQQPLVGVKACAAMSITLSLSVSCLPNFYLTFNFNIHGNYLI